MGDMVTEFAKRAMDEVRREARRNVVNIEPRRRRLHRIRPHRFHGFIIPNLPLWANVLILVAIIIAGLFLVGIITGFLQERARSKRLGQRMRVGHIFWKGLVFAFFLWIPIGIYNLIRHRSLKGKKAAAYREIHEDERALTTGEAKSFRSSLPPGSRSRSDLDADSRYEPMSYGAGAGYNAYSPQINQGSQRQTPEIDISEGRSRANSASAELFKPPPPQTSGAPSPPAMHQPPATYTGGGYGAPEHH